MTLTDARHSGDRPTPPVPAPASVVWLADRWRRIDHTVLLTRALAVLLASAVAVMLAATPLWLPQELSGAHPVLAPPGWVQHDPQRWFGLAATVAGLLGVVAVLVAVRLTWLATVLAVVPFLLVAAYGTFLGSSWLALGAVAVVVASRRPVASLVPWACAAATAVVWQGTGPVGIVERPALMTYGPGYPTGGVSGLGAGLMIAAYSAGAVAIAAWLGHVLRVGVARMTRALADAEHARTERALTAERTRLARELHDVVAHHVSLVAVRAESVPFGIPGLDPRAARAFTLIADDARTALTELRHVLTVLRRDEDAPLLPLTGAQDVPALVATARGAGQDVTVDGSWPTLAGGVGHVLHRAVQEGLSNARRHAHDAPVRVVLQSDGTVVGFRMTNRVLPSAAAVPAHGLTGMRERVESLGGAVSAEVDGGTFVLVVSLPVDVP